VSGLCPSGRDRGEVRGVEGARAPFASTDPHFEPIGAEFSVAGLVNGEQFRYLGVVGPPGIFSPNPVNQVVQEQIGVYGVSVG
jgi:hypothetical protein